MKKRNSRLLACALAVVLCMTAFFHSHLCSRILRLERKRQQYTA